MTVVKSIEHFWLAIVRLPPNMSEQCISVLIIEDNPGDARLVQEALKGASDPSFTVEWVDRLSSGLARLADGGIDVLLLDLGLPDSQGLAALALIRALAPPSRWWC